jgi:hypothetical protein
LLKKPSAKTLTKYGMTEVHWHNLASLQYFVCGVCGKLPPSGRLHIDHEHVKGWKKLPPDQRRRYVRGLACFRCNSQFMRRGLTLELAKSVVDYLEQYATYLQEARHD